MSSSTLLEKLGLKNISEMSDDELRQMVANDRTRRVAVRVAGRIKRMSTGGKPSHRIVTLESLNLPPALISKLRAGGKSDAEIIVGLKAAGMI